MRRSVPSWIKGGTPDAGRHLGRSSAPLQRCRHGGRLRDAEPLCQGCQGASRGITKGAERRQQRGEQNMYPLMGFALAHPEEAPVHHLERRGFQGDQNEE